MRKAVEHLKKLCEKDPKVKKEIVNLLKKWNTTETELVPGHYLTQTIEFLAEQAIDPNLVHVEFDLKQKKMSVINRNTGDAIWRIDLY